MDNFIVYLHQNLPRILKKLVFKSENNLCLRYRGFEPRDQKCIVSKFEILVTRFESSISRDQLIFRIEDQIF